VGGTLIGAVRHKGWIPWDGDIDVHMFDTDWETFIKVADDELPTTLFVQDISTDVHFKANIGKIRDLYSSYTLDTDESHSGLQIDIFKYKNTYVDGAHVIQSYIYIFRDDDMYLDTGDFSYDMIFPLKELPFEGISVYVPGDYVSFCKMCYGEEYPPAMPTVDKRCPQEGYIDPYNANPRVLELYKELYEQKTNEWFRRSALKYNNAPLHHSSGWTYLSNEQWLQFLASCLQGLNFDAAHSVFEGGCGVGAVLRHIHDAHPKLLLDGIDICTEAVSKCVHNVPNVRVSVQDLCNLSIYADASFDIVLSVCALSYLESIDAIRRSVLELIRITKPGGSMRLCVFTEMPQSLKSLRTLVPKSWWQSFNSLARVYIEDIPMDEFKDRYNVHMTKNMFV
jgi:SAM-dependent methyltransferase